MKKKSQSVAKRVWTLILVMLMVVTALPTTALADDRTEGKKEDVGVVHDYGKTGDDPATVEDESAIVANEDVLKSAQYQESTKYSLTANNTPVSVFKYQKKTSPSNYYHMDIARFSSDDESPVLKVTLNDGTTIDSVTVYPERYYGEDAFEISEDKKTLTFEMSGDLRYCIVNVNGSIYDTDGKPQLAIINDPTETNKPDVNAANVLNFKTFSEKYLEENPITDTVGEVCTEAGTVTDTSLNNGVEYTYEYGEGVYQAYTDKNVMFPNKRARLSYDVTDAFQAALEEVRNSDTLDTIYFPAGTYIWSGLSIKNWDGNGEDGALNIYLDEDALLVNRLQECQEAMEPAIGIWYSSNITVSGRGIIDGQGTYNYTMDVAHARQTTHQGGAMVVHSQDITFNDTYVRDVKQWNWECHTVENVTYNNIKGLSPYQHSWVDGLDLTSGKNVTVNGAFTMGNDDTFATGHYNPSDGFPYSQLKGKDMENLSEEDNNIAAAAAIYNKERLEWDTKDSENITVKDAIGWSTFANAVRFGHNTKWKEDGGSYQLKSYTFDNYNTVHVLGYGSNGGGGSFSVQNGTSGCTPNYQSLVFENCSFTANAGNSAMFPNSNYFNNFNPEQVILRNCWFGDVDTPIGFKKIQNVTVEDLYLGGKLVEYTSQVNLTLGEGDQAVGSFTFLADGQPVKENSLPQITSFEDKLIQAYADNPLIFYVKAEDADGDEITLADVDVSEMEGASFDTTTGKFSWKPSQEEIGNTYSVTFAVSDYTNQLVEKTVEIQVSSPANSAQRYMVSEDAHVQTWKAEKNNNYGTKNFLTAALISNKGLLGEQFASTSTSDGTDGKIIYLKFDLTEIKEQESLYDKAELALTFIKKRDSKMSGQNTTLRVAKVDDSSWTETGLTWNTRPTFEVTEETVKISEEFALGTEYQDQSKFGTSANATINGTVVKTDIKDLVDEALKNGEDTLTLAVCNAGGVEVYFVSREGAVFFNNATEDMAPAILLNLPTELDIEGPKSMELYQEYEAAESNSFALKGEGPFEVTLSGATGDGKITWDANSQQIKVAEGLKKGEYAVNIMVKNQNNVEKTVAFTVNVVEDPKVTVAKEELQTVYDSYKDMTQDNYTDQSWDAFTKALANAKAVLENETVKADDIIDAKEDLQNAVEALMEKQPDVPVVPEVEFMITVYGILDGEVITTNTSDTITEAISKDVLIEELEAGDTTVEGAKFLGYFLDKDGMKELAELPDTIDEDIEIYMIWEKLPEGGDKDSEQDNPNPDTKPEEIPASPATGDTNSVVFYAVVSFAAIVVVAVFRKRNMR